MSNYEAHDAYVALQAHADGLEPELAAARAELAEANAVIGRVRKVREALDRRRKIHYTRWVEDDHDSDAASTSAYADAVGQLNRVEGL